jgi:phosphatidylglycerophosphate synthase
MTSTASPHPFAAPSAEGGDREATGAQPTRSTQAERQALAVYLDDPLNRWYRYPAARALYKVAGRLPLRPDHVTYIHTTIGVLGAALVAYGSRAALASAFVLLEIRMVLDCYDGVLAREKKLSSPRGRTLDELGDAVAFIALCAGMTVHLYRLRPFTSTLGMVLFGALLLATGAMSGHAYDFYKRRLGSALKEGRDAIAEELEQKLAIVRRGGAPWITRFGIWFDRWQVRLYEPRYAGGDAVGAVVGRAHSPGLRFLVHLIGILSWDNALALLHVGLLFGFVLEVQLVALGYGFVLFTAALVTMRRVLGAKGAAA